MRRESILLISSPIPCFLQAFSLLTFFLFLFTFFYSIYLFQPSFLIDFFLFSLFISTPINCMLLPSK